MTTYTAPPDKTNLELDRGDVLDVHSGGTATGTTIQFGGVAHVNGGATIDTTLRAFGVENVYDHGVADHTTIKRGGAQNIASGGTANHTLLEGGNENIGRGGVTNGTIVFDGSENVNGGASNDTIVNRDGVERVTAGVANNTTIHGGVEEVTHGVADNVIFSGSGSLLELRSPTNLQGTISDWSVGDVIRFSNRDHIMSVHESADNATLTVNYFDDDHGNQTVTYSLAGQQANTQIELRHDRHGGADLVLVSVTGIQALHHHHEIA
jgi:autotransporter passenger strand-loop-strand repeat protein